MRQLSYIGLILFGLALAILGVLAGLFYLGLPVVSPSANYDLLQVNAVAVALMALAVGMGLVFGWVGWRAYAGIPARAAHLPNPLWFLLVFVLALISGRGVLATPMAPWLFPPLHVLASIAPPFFFLSLAVLLVSRGRPMLRNRDVLLQLAGGSILATGLALFLEILFVVVLALLAGALVSALPGGLQRIEVLITQLRTPDLAQDPLFWQTLLSSPVVLVGAGLVVTVGAPMIEEAAKSIGILLVGASRPLPSPAEAFLWGVAAGAGFAITESLLNGLGALPAWVEPVTLRGGTALVHCLAAGLTGLGWQAWLSRGRRWRLVTYYGLAVAVHGLWNGVAALASYLQLQGLATGSLLAGTGGLLFLLLLGGLFVIDSGLFGYLSLRLGDGGQAAAR